MVDRGAPSPAPVVTPEPLVPPPPPIRLSSDPVAAREIAEPFDLGRSWLRTLAQLTGVPRVTVSDNATPGSYNEGTLCIIVRKEMWRQQVRDALGGLDLGGPFPGFRRLEVEVAGDVGRTGRERRTDADAAALAAATAAAENSVGLRRLLTMFSAVIEEVEAIAPPRSDTELLESEVSDD